MNHNEPAFPTLHTIDGNWVKEPKKELQGLTKREYFAAMAMQGILAACNNPDIGGPQYEETTVAQNAIKMADELLKQLSL